MGALGNAAGTASSMTKKTETKYHEPEKTLGGALGSMLAGGAYGLGMADMFTGGEATDAMWSGVKGALRGGAAETSTATTMAAEAVNALTPVATAAGSTAVPAGVASLNLGNMGAITGSAEAMASAGSALEGVAGGALTTTMAPEAVEAASVAGPVGWGMLAAGALAGLASYWL